MQSAGSRTKLPSGRRLFTRWNTKPLAELQKMVGGMLGGGAASDATEPGGLLSDKLGLWGRGNYSFGNKAASSSAPKFDADQWGLLLGMPILWNLKPVDGGWGGGEGYKPSQDLNFKAKSVKLVEGGKKLEVTGCKLFICKTATWVRAN